MNCPNRMSPGNAIYAGTRRVRDALLSAGMDAGTADRAGVDKNLFECAR